MISTSSNLFLCFRRPALFDDGLVEKIKVHQWPPHYRIASVKMPGILGFNLSCAAPPLGVNTRGPGHLPHVAKQVINHEKSLPCRHFLAFRVWSHDYLFPRDYLSPVRVRQYCSWLPLASWGGLAGEKAEGGVVTKTDGFFWGFHVDMF